MVVYAIIFSLFERKFIDCPKFTSRSRTHMGHDATKAESIAMTMETFLTKKSEELLMNSDVEMEEMIASVMETVGKGDKKQNFAGMFACRNIIDQVTEEVEVTLPYLYSIAKDKKTGVVHVPYVYFCRGKNASGVYGMCKPVMTRIAVRVQLPSLSRMANPLCIQRMQKYLTPWIKKVSMTAPAITEMVGTANNRKYWDTSASVEGTFGSGKNHRSNNGTTFASVEQLIDARWNESLGSERQLRYEMQRNKDVLERREMNTISNKNEGETIGGKRKRNTEETNDMSKKKSKLGKSVGEVNNEYDVDSATKRVREYTIIMTIG